MPRERLGQREQPQRLGGGCAVDHDEVPGPGLHLRAQLQQGHDLVGSRQRGQLLAHHGVDAEGAEQGVDESRTSCQEVRAEEEALTCNA